MITTANLTREDVLAVLRYDPRTGKFARTSGRKSVGTITRDGYLRITIGNHRILAHRLAWLLVYGSYPDCDIDHINADRLDNRITNLRLANRAQNMANCLKHRDNRSGFKGVSWSAKRKRFYAHICKDGKHIYLGSFETAAAASAAYQISALQMHGEFARGA